MLIYAVSDRRLRPDLDPVELVESMASSGADMIQIREKDLPTGPLLSLTRRAVAVRGAAVLVNGRPDVALAAGAAGVHLPSDGIPAGAIRARWGRRLEIGVSTHTVEEARAAEAAGANLITFGPVFETASKRSYGPPVGVAMLVRAVEAVRIPVFAIGGIGPGNVAALSGVPLAGIAMISSIIGAEDLGEAVKRLRDAAGASGSAERTG